MLGVLLDHNNQLSLRVCKTLLITTQTHVINAKAGIETFVFAFTLSSLF